MAVISQRLRFRPELNIRVPECEILSATHAVKSFIRQRDFFKIASALETGADHDMWSFQRYARWLDSRTNWFVPGKNPEPPDSDVTEAVPGSIPLPMPVARKSVKGGPGPQLPAPADAGGRLEIEAVEGGLENILRNLK